MRNRIPYKRQIVTIQSLTRRLHADVSGTTDSDEPRKLSDEIEKAITEHFEIRQKIRAGARGASKHKSDVCRSCTTREREKNRIISDRLRQLLRDTDGLGWGSSDAGARASACRGRLPAGLLRSVNAVKYASIVIAVQVRVPRVRYCSIHQVESALMTKLLVSHAAPRAPLPYSHRHCFGRSLAAQGGLIDQRRFAAESVAGGRAPPSVQRSRQWKLLLDCVPRGTTARSGWRFRGNRCSGIACEKAGLGD